MNDKEHIKATFDEVRRHEAGNTTDRMNDAERQREQEVRSRQDRLRAVEVDRYEVDGPLESLGERNRILLEQASPELRPDGMKRKPMSFEQVCERAQDICDRRHQARLDQIGAEAELEISDLQQEVAERIAREGEQAKGQDLSDGFNRESEAKGHDTDNEFGDFYRGSDERDGGRDR